MLHSHVHVIYKNMSLLLWKMNSDYTRHIYKFFLLMSTFFDMGYF